MMKFSFKKLVPIFLLISLSVSTNCIATGDMDFPEPDFLSDNVEFWKKIYTEVSIKEGLIHDRKHPLIIYKKIKVGNRRGRSLSRYVKNQKKEIVHLLEKINNVSPSFWSHKERRIISQFKMHASM